MGPFEADFGTPATALTLGAPATIGTLLEALASRWPAAARLSDLLRGKSPQRRYCYVSLDYQMLPPDAVLDTPLHDGGRVCFGMPMVGG